MEEYKSKQSHRHILMVRPSFFASNYETTKDNVFMDQTKDAADKSISKSIKKRAVEEWERLVEKIKSETSIIVHEIDNHEEGCPDACFPNNVFSTHRTAKDSVTTFWYPMKAPSRRKERANPNLSPSLYSFYEESSLSVIEEDLTEFENKISIWRERDRLYWIEYIK